MTASATASPEEMSGRRALTHRQIMLALSGLLMGMVVTMLSSTVVSASLPVIIADLGGTQTAYTWVVTATLLAMTVSTPVWGKLADITNRKVLIQSALVLFTIGSMLAGLSGSTGFLIACRAIQGLGAGGVMALVQVILADILSPRERGKYMGLLGAVTMIPTVIGPLLGGAITDSIGWEWNFYVGVPFAIAALYLLQRNLPVVVHAEKKKLDYAGTVVIAAAVSLLLIWVSLGGSEFEWGSITSYVMVIGAAVLATIAVLVERRAKNPLIPPRLFSNRTLVLAVIASAAIGIALFGTGVFLTQYMQLAQGKTPTVAGLFTIPMAVGSLISSIVIGRLITKTGIWKRYVVGGTIVCALGFFGLGTLDASTSLVNVCIFMALVGLGMGPVMQNMVLVVQNTTPVKDMGAASSTVSFFRSMAGTLGVALLGSILASRVAELIADGFAKAGIDAAGNGGGAVPDMATLPEPIRLIVESAYGDAIGHTFFMVAPVLLIAIVATLLLPNKPLGTKSGIEQRQDGLTSLEADADEPSLLDAPIIVADPADGDAVAVRTPAAKTSGR
ncbi:MDR family MFS transporter [Cumulibacter soli]|uniref:MDR family MFS transporter n=1 Tax=Cumulibacter soli TaxID=2546344 RepID=UPI001ABAA291|nr:MDR family MFS transporter [Cumulibacter soli]